jgi:hypothetical protein
MISLASEVQAWGNWYERFDDDLAFLRVDQKMNDGDHSLDLFVLTYAHIHPL